MSNIASTTSTKNRSGNNRANAIRVEPSGSISTTSNKMTRVQQHQQQKQQD